MIVLSQTLILQGLSLATITGLEQKTWPFVTVCIRPVTCGLDWFEFICFIWPFPKKRWR